MEQNRKDKFSMSIAIDPVAWERNGARVAEWNQKRRIIEYKKPKTRLYQQTLKLMFNCCNREPMEGPLVVDLKFFLPIPQSWSLKKKRAAMNGELLHIGMKDIDNLAKAVFDAANKVLWIDDGQIVDAHLSKRYGEDPHIEMVVESYGGEET